MKRFLMSLFAAAALALAPIASMAETTTDAEIMALNADEVTCSEILDMNPDGMTATTFLMNMYAHKGCSPTALAAAAAPGENAEATRISLCTEVMFTLIIIAMIEEMGGEIDAETLENIAFANSLYAALQCSE